LEKMVMPHYQIYIWVQYLHHLNVHF
jgi:hypothetical protein